MRLLIITQTVDKNHTNLGFFHEWLVKLAAEVESLTVICLGVGEYVLPKNVTVLSLGKERRVSGLAYVVNFFRYLWRYRAQYDRVLVHMNPEYIVLAGWWWRFTNKPIFLWYVHRSVTWKLWLAEKFVKKIFTASPESFRLSSKKVKVVGHGIDTDFFYPSNVSQTDGKIRLLSAGRISRSKSLEVIIKAADFLIKKGFDFQLMIAGMPLTDEDRKYHMELLRLTAVIDPEGKYIVRNPLKKTGYYQMPNLYRGGSLFLHASKTGSLDKVVLEALASGLTVFSSSEAYAHWPDFLIKFKPQDAEGLAQAIQMWAEQPEVTAVERGRQYVMMHFSLETLIKRLVGEMN